MLFHHFCRHLYAGHLAILPPTSVVKPVHPPARQALVTTYRGDCQQANELNGAVWVAVVQIHLCAIVHAAGRVGEEQCDLDSCRLRRGILVRLSTFKQTAYVINQNIKPCEKAAV